MKLSDYLKAKNLTYQQFEELSGIPFQMIGKYVNGSCPRKENMRLIFEATGGLVTANDFNDIDTASAPPAPPTAVVGEIMPDGG